MRTERNGQRWRVGVVAAAAMLMAGGVSAQTVTTDRPAGYIVFPKIVSDPSGLFTGGVAVDTLIQITNTNSSGPRAAHCFFVDGTSRCSNGASEIDPDGACRDNKDCNPGGVCRLATCQGENFDILMTANQPIGWLASEGVLQENICQGGSQTGFGCDDDTDCPGGSCVVLNIGRIPPLSPGVFQGELKCVESAQPSAPTVTPLPLNANDLIGNATIYRVLGGTGTSQVDVRQYNAIGLQSVLNDGALQSDIELQLGGAGAEYAGCPAQLIVNHFFDNAQVGTNTSVVTNLTFVPCSERLESDPDPVPTQLQFLVYNEFEQRFSASTGLSCFRTLQMSNIDRRAGQESTSIFNVAVQGTLAGQTVVRPVLSSITPQEGNGVLAIAEEFYSTGRSTAYNINLRGTKSQADWVLYQ